MILVDTALKEAENNGQPIRVGLVGAGYMGRGICLQVTSSIPGMEIVAISNRNLQKAKSVYKDCNISSINHVSKISDLEKSIKKNQYAVTDDPFLLCLAEGIDAIIEATGEIEFGAQVALEAIKNKKHIILMNAELDATLGPILKVYADEAGVIITNADGDQPGVIMNLYRSVKSLGYNPVLAGNIKGLQDHYRTPETQKKFAENNNMTPKMATSFADGTKISMEMAVVANATGFSVGIRGMYGPKCSHVNEVLNLFPLEKMNRCGLVDYILGAEPGPGVFLIGYNEDPIKRQYMDYFKMGEGPYYVFYTPYHLPHLEVPFTVARAVLFNDATITPIGKPVCEVVTASKRNLKKGEILDGIGGFLTYGVIDNAHICRSNNLLNMGLSEGCVLLSDIPKDYFIKVNDVIFPQSRVSNVLWDEQREHFDLP